MLSAHHKFSYQPFLFLLIAWVWHIMALLSWSVIHVVYYITQVDKYFTVQPHTLIRQHLDYSHWYDRQKLSLKDVHNTQYVSCMNPTAGSFTINPRLQRHFCVFALSFPGRDALATIYTSILTQVSYTILDDLFIFYYFIKWCFVIKSVSTNKNWKVKWDLPMK